jgi:hypothetical protein
VVGSTAGALRHAAFALDAAVFDLAYITGPVLASSLAAGVAPAAAVPPWGYCIPPRCGACWSPGRWSTSR